MRGAVLLLMVFLLTVQTSVAGNIISTQDTLRTTIYDPTDYNAVMRQLERASRPTFGQRIASALTTPLVQSENLQLTGHAGVAYTQETNLMLAVSASATYRSNDKQSVNSSAALTAMASINGFFNIQASGTNYIGQGNDKLTYNAGGGSMPTRFWSLGYDAADDNLQTNYTRKQVGTSIKYMHRFTKSIWAGAGINLGYNKAAILDFLGVAYLTTGNQQTRSAFTSGISLNGTYDTRDNEYNPTRGFYIALTGEMRPKSLGNYDKTLWNFNFQADYFQSLWRGGVMALDLYGDLWSKDTPWLYWPSVGGTSRMRGYYLGRYMDCKMLTAQVELRQTIYGPIGVCVWGGAGNVFDSFKNFDTSKILPNGGLGVRLAVDGRTVLRIDYGFGRHSRGLIINVNEAF